jgi:hypothetical protein
VRLVASARRFPVLMAFCVEPWSATDDAIEVFDRALGAADRAAQRKREEVERRGRRDIQTTVRRFIDLLRPRTRRARLRRRHPAADRATDRGIEQLRADRDRAQGIVRPADTGHLDLLIADSGTAARKLLASVIESLELRSAGTDEDELLAAVRLIRQLAGDKRRWLPGLSPERVHRRPVASTRR